MSDFLRNTDEKKPLYFTLKRKTHLIVHLLPGSQIYFINDLDRGIESTSKLGDDKRLGILPNSSESIKVIQEDLDRIQKWAETSQMKFSIRQEYFMGCTKLESSQVERDLRVIKTEAIQVLVNVQ